MPCGTSVSGRSRFTARRDPIVARAGARWRAGCRPAALGARVRLRRLTEQVPSCAGRAAARTGGSRITPGLRPVRFSATPPRRTARRARATVGRLRSHISATQTGPRRGRAGRPRAEPGPSHHSRQTARKLSAPVLRSCPGGGRGSALIAGDRCALGECGESFYTVENEPVNEHTHRLI